MKASESCTLALDSVHSESKISRIAAWKANEALDREPLDRVIYNYEKELLLRAFGIILLNMSREWGCGGGGEGDGFFSVTPSARTSAMHVVRL